jgi:hypothetical protein
VIEDLDGVIEPRPTWRQQWLVPAAGALLLSTVLAASFLRFEPAHASVLRGEPVRASVRQQLTPATGVKAIELPRTVATLEARLQFSGTTGLTKMNMSDGFRDTYQLADGRRLSVIEVPAPRGSAAGYPGALDLPHRVAVRGEMGIGYSTALPALPTVIAWTADGMQYTVAGAAFSEEELVRLASQLR